MKSLTLPSHATEVAGEVVVEGHREALLIQARADFTVSANASPLDLVTTADETVERIMGARLKASYPDHSVAGEELGQVTQDESAWQWLIDPIDGTNNYAYGLSTFGTAVTLKHDGSPVVAAIAHGSEVVVATCGHGVQRNSTLHVRAASMGTVRTSALWLGYGVDRNRQPVNGLLSELHHTSRRVLETWAPTVDAILYLRGGVDLIVGHRCAGAELSACFLVLREAGAEIVGLDGCPADLAAPPETFVAGSPNDVAKFLALHTKHR